ncbi:hypothetical protein HZH68_012346 [Vespula germanica]|uniref:C2H2-type domain-containing protein n=1 Tax=Vespula germanica TaxID=30212 RepID=A0A834JHF8_VESGE|nr:hypothetical protein HZH68_012346 [Vespula germanica]
MGEGIRIPYYPRKQWTGSMDRSSGCVSLNQNDGNRHPCPKCYRSYKHRSHMIRHYRYECGTPQRFECPYCKHHLRQRTHVWTHIRTLHPNQELYCIDIEFHVSPSSLVIPNFMCKYRPENGNETIRRNNNDNDNDNNNEELRMPMLKPKRVEKKRPFSCQKCGRAFTLKRNKDRHVNYECGHEPRFQCPYCGLRSKQTSPVYNHIRKKHPDEEVFIFDMKI